MSVSFLLKYQLVMQTYSTVGAGIRASSFGFQVSGFRFWVSGLDEYPDLQDFTVSQVRSELQVIEAETYAEFVRAGQLNQELSPFLQQAAESKNE